MAFIPHWEIQRFFWVIVNIYFTELTVLEQIESFATKEKDKAQRQNDKLGSNVFFLGIKFRGMQHYAP